MEIWLRESEGEMKLQMVIVAWKLDVEQTFTKRDLDAFSSMIAVNRYFNGDVAHV